jgi:predicted metal-dependent peptidase
MERCSDTMLKLSWLHPFFAIPAAKAKLIEDPGPRCPTAYVTADAYIHLNPAFCGPLSDAQLMGILAHELCHPMFAHFSRQQGRVRSKWGRAIDMAINHGLRDAGIELPDGGLYPPRGLEDKSAEQLYDLIHDEDGDGDGEDNGNDKGEPRPGEGCGPRPPEGENEDGSVRGTEEVEREWQEVAIQASQMAKTCGNEAGRGLMGIVKIPPARVKWPSIIRGGMDIAAAGQGKDLTTWNRRGRRSPVDGPQHPGWTKTTARIAVVIDTSGSMSDKALAQCIAETVACARQAETPIYLVTHDAKVQWEGWINPRDRAAKVKAACRGRGGTCAEEAYKRVGEAARRFDVMVHLTDCELYWPAWPGNVKKKIIARIESYHGTVPEGAKVIDVQV